MPNNNEDDIIKDRKKQYGDYSAFKRRMLETMNILKWHRGETGSITEYDVDNFFLVLKILRLQTAKDADSLIDLSNYAKLIKESRKWK